MAEALPEDYRPREEDGNEEELDPRVEGALTELNNATNNLNDVEKQAEAFKLVVKEMNEYGLKQIKDLSIKVGKKTIDKAREYYQPYAVAVKAKAEVKAATIAFEKAMDAYKEAKAFSAETDRMLSSSHKIDDALQQRLNESNDKFAVADQARRKAEALSLKKTLAFQEAEKAAIAALKPRRSVVTKAKPYFDFYFAHNKRIRDIGGELVAMQSKHKAAKDRVKKALAYLEQISTEIHLERVKRRSQATAAATTDHAKRIEETIAAADKQLLSTHRVEQIDPLQKARDDTSSIASEELMPDLSEADTDSLTSDTMTLRYDESYDEAYLDVPGHRHTLSNASHVSSDNSAPISRNLSATGLDKLHLS